MTHDAITEEEVVLVLRRDIEILVVDDDHTHFLLARHWLQSVGVENNILWFEDGQAIVKAPHARTCEPPMMQAMLTAE